MPDDLMNVDRNALRAAVRAALARLDIRALVRAAIDQQSPEFRPDLSVPPHARMLPLIEMDRLDHDRRKRARAVRVAIDTAWSQTWLPSPGCPTGAARGIELRSVSLFGVDEWLPVGPGNIRR